MHRTLYATKQLYCIITSVQKPERNNSGLRNLFTLLTKPVKISQLVTVKGTYLIFQA